jgi:hypothetical protein
MKKLNLFIFYCLSSTILNASNLIKIYNDDIVISNFNFKDKNTISIQRGGNKTYEEVNRDGIGVVISGFKANKNILFKNDLQTEFVVFKTNTNQSLSFFDYIKIKQKKILEEKLLSNISFIENLPVDTFLSKPISKKNLELLLGVSLASVSDGKNKLLKLHNLLLKNNFKHSSVSDMLSINTLVINSPSISDFNSLNLIPNLTNLKINSSSDSLAVENFVKSSTSLKKLDLSSSLISHFNSDVSVKFNSFLTLNYNETSIDDKFVVRFEDKPISIKEKFGTDDSDLFDIDVAKAKAYNLNISVKLIGPKINGIGYRDIILFHPSHYISLKGFINLKKYSIQQPSIYLDYILSSKKITVDNTWNEFFSRDGSSLSTISNEKYKYLLKNMKVGMLFISGNHKYFIQKNKLLSPACIPLTPDFGPDFNSSNKLFHHEDSGCNVSGKDYTLISTKYVYQFSSIKFDVWSTCNSSYPNNLCWFTKLSGYIK